MEGDIYCVTSPSGKQYIGQAIKVLSNGKKHGYLGRWKHHLNEAKNFKMCSVALDNAIRKYGNENFKIELLKECLLDELDYWENYYINEYNTLHPNGYNLITGRTNGRQSELTKQKRKESMMGKNKGKKYDKRERLNEEDNDLPKYVRHYRDKNGKEGYRISNHPQLKDKSFVGKYVTMEEKYNKAIEYLNNTDNRSNE
jgi:hypothetical protein